VHEIRDWAILAPPHRIPSYRAATRVFHPPLSTSRDFRRGGLTESIPTAIAPRSPRTASRCRSSGPAPHCSIRSPIPNAVSAEFRSAAFLIKQVVEELRRELPTLENS